MKNSIRTIFLLVFFCLPWQTPSSAADDRIVVGFPENPPLIFTDTDGQVKGVAVDLLSAIAGEEDWQMHYLPGSYSDCIRRMEEGTVDLFPGMVVDGDDENRFILGRETIIANRVPLHSAPDAVLSDTPVKRPARLGLMELRFAVSRERNRGVLDTLDRHVKRLKENPNSIFYSSQDRWTHGVRKVTLPLWLRPLWVLSAIGVIMGLIVLGNVFLRRQVKLQTEALKVTIAEKEKIESELSVAREIQLQLVPGDFPAFSNRKEFDIYACLEPAREVGGDFYDCFFIDGNHLCLVIGDVSGKGVPAALFMAMTKTMVKSAARLLAEPEYILADVNREIARNNPSLTFVTVFLGILNLSTGALTYSSAGHNPPLFIGRKGNSVLLGEAQCPAIGFDDAFQYRQATVTMQHGESLLLYTDGVTEAQDSQGRMFTQEALMNTVSLTAGLSSREQVTAIVSRVREFTGERPLDDDLTLLSITYFSPHHIGTTGKTIVLRNDIHEMVRIVEAISQIAESASCPRVVVHDVTLAIEEVFSNIVFHGFGDDLDHNITLELFVDKTALTIILQDGGIPFNPLNVQVGREKPLEERDKGGMGIMLAKNLMDRMEYRRDKGKNILRLEKRFR